MSSGIHVIVVEKVVILHRNSAIEKGAAAGLLIANPVMVEIPSDLKVVLASERCCCRPIQLLG